MSLRSEVEDAAVLADELHKKVKHIMERWSGVEREAEMLEIDRALGHILIASNCLDDAFWSLDGKDG